MGKGCRYRLLDLSNLGFGIIEPVGTPDAMESPTSPFQEILSQAVSFTGNVPRMVRSAICLDSQNVPTEKIRVANCKINPIGSHAYLGIKLEACLREPIPDINFEGIQRHGVIRSAMEFLASGRDKAQEAVHEFETCRSMCVLGDVVQGKAGYESHAAPGTADCHIEPAFSSFLKERTPQVPHFSIYAFAVSHGENNGVPFIALDPFNALDKETLIVAREGCFKFRILNPGTIEGHLDAVLVFDTERDHAQ